MNLACFMSRPLTSNEKKTFDDVKESAFVKRQRKNEQIAEKERLDKLKEDHLKRMALKNSDTATEPEKRMEKEFI
ncbi:hypothetical protein HCB37_16710 [Listeria booriae]|uniref:hypothetical protein n=1 Tax=Listeria booriae TaxID=1552123 RepID=UPI001625152A|nr:hypothetical protein [Listeria booriae]MBC1248128.1 hypothetical protein [Listeria booriae]MBC2266145.1 hypothetical protein [Listeria booriae]